MTYDCAWKLDQGRDVRVEISMIKSYATEMAWEVVDRAMQTFGAMAPDQELPLQLMASPAHHANLRRPHRSPQMGGGPQPDGIETMKTAYGDHLTVTLEGHVATATIDRPPNNHVLVDLMRDPGRRPGNPDRDNKVRAVAAGLRRQAVLRRRRPGRSWTGSAAVGMSGINHPL